MILYISFGQIHVHSINGKTLDKDCIAAIKCDNYEEGRAKAFEWFEGKFAFDYLEMSDETLSYFPRGIIPVNF